MDSNGLLKKVNNTGPFIPSVRVKIYEGTWKNWFIEDIVTILSDGELGAETAAEEAGVDVQAEVKKIVQVPPLAKSMPTPVLDTDTAPLPVYLNAESVVKSPLSPPSMTEGHVDREEKDESIDKTQKLSEKER